MRLMIPELGKRFRRFSLAALLFLQLIICSCVPWRGYRIDPSSDVKIRIPVIENSVLSNGASIYYMGMENSALITLRCAFRAGESSSPEEKAGSLLLLYHYILYSQTDLLKEFDKLGAHPSLQFDQDESALEVTTGYEHLALAFELMVKLVREPRFEAARFDEVKKRLLYSMAWKAHSPSSRAESAIRLSIYGRQHPLGRTDRYVSDSIGMMMLEDIVHAYGEYVGPRNIALIVIGRTSQAAVTALARKFLGNWISEAEEAPVAPPPARHRREAVMVVAAPGRRFSRIALGALGVQMGHEEETVLGMATKLVSETMEARLEERGIYWNRIERSSFSSRSAGHFVISIEVPSERTWIVIEEMLGAIFEIKTRLIPIYRFPSFRSHQLWDIVGPFLDRNLTTTSISQIFWKKLPVSYHLRKLDAIKATGLDSVEEAFIKYFSPEHLHIAIVADPGIFQKNVPSELLPIRILEQ